MIEKLKIFLNPKHPKIGQSAFKTLTLHSESNRIISHHVALKPSDPLLRSFVIKLIHVVQQIVGSHRLILVAGKENL